MTREELTQRLEAVTEDGVATWYAIHQTPEDIDDGDGSTNPEEAAEMAVKSDAYSIVLIYDNGSNEAYDELVIKDTARYQIEARQTNDPAQVDGYGTWDYVGEWESDCAEDALDEWLDEQRYETEGFERTGKCSYRIDGAEYDARVAKEA